MTDVSDIYRLLQEQKFAQAIPLIEDKLQEDPLQTELKARLAYCYFREQEFDKSIALINECLSIEPHNPVYISDRGLTYFMQGKGPEALADFNRAQELDPENPYRYSSRAYIKDVLGDTAGAIADYQKTLEIDPQDAVAYNNLGLLLEKQGRKEEAGKLFKKADSLSNAQDIDLEQQQESQNAETAAEPLFPENNAASNRMNARFYFSTLREVFTSRQGFKEFMDFLMRRS